MTKFRYYVYQNEENILSKQLAQIQSQTMIVSGNYNIKFKQIAAELEDFCNILTGCEESAKRPGNLQMPYAGQTYIVSMGICLVTLKNVFENGDSTQYTPPDSLMSCKKIYQ